MSLDHLKRLFHENIVPCGKENNYKDNYYGLCSLQIKMWMDRKNKGDLLTSL